MNIEDYLENVRANTDEIKREIFQKMYELLQKRSTLVINLSDSKFYHLGNLFDEVNIKISKKQISSPFAH
jgi:hypothetical protein